MINRVSWLAFPFGARLNGFLRFDDVFMVLDMLGAVALLAGAFGTVAERSFGGGVAIEAANAARMYWGLASLFGAGLVVAATLGLLQIAQMVGAKKYEVIKHRREDQQSLHPITDDQAVA